MLARLSACVCANIIYLQPPRCFLYISAQTRSAMEPINISVAVLSASAASAWLDQLPFIDQAWHTQKKPFLLHRWNLVTCKCALWRLEAIPRGCHETHQRNVVIDWLLFIPYGTQMNCTNWVQFVFTMAFALKPWKFAYLREQRVDYSSKSHLGKLYFFMNIIYSLWYSRI
jgi:hypothetical protein